MYLLMWVLPYLVSGTIAFPADDENQTHVFRKTSLSNISSIESSQPLAGEPFIGNAVKAAHLAPKIPFYPKVTLMHQDGGNDGSTDYPGPLGHNTSVSSVVSTTVSLHTFFWDANGNMIAGISKTTAGSSSYVFGLAAIEKDTLEILSTWTVAEGQTLNLPYAELLQDTNTIVITSKQGQIYVVEFSCEASNPAFNLIRTANLTAVLSPGELLLNGMSDTSNNIWFTSGGLLAQVPGSLGDPSQNSTTIGYVEPCGTIHTMHIKNQMVENGMAVSGKNVYIVTGPSGIENGTNGTGNMYALTSGAGTSITTIWQTSYSAGAARKPGAFARGSGSTPVLLGDQYIAITDNSNSQINLIIYNQKATAKQVVCSVPIFQPNAGNNDLAVLAHLDGDKYGVILFNDYNCPPVYWDDGDINGAFNNLSIMAAETVRVDVKADGSGCEVAWDTPIRIQSVPVLSTESGLIYGYTQDAELADQGIYEWYVAAINWVTGAIAWQVRAGAGGSFNDNYHPGTLGPDGRFYQAVLGGVVIVEDKKAC